MIRNTRHHLLLDLAFFAGSYFILLGIFSDSSHILPIDQIYTALFLGTLVLAAMANHALTLSLLRDKKYISAFATFVLVVLAGTFFNQILFDRLIDLVLPGYYFISYYEWLDIFKFFIAFVIVSSLLHLSFEWFTLQESRRQLALIEKEKVEIELKALTAQINPHFLFNSLTVIYGLSLNHSAHTPDAVIKLSDILRYVIYESTKGKVSAESEVELIKNYIKLQRYRVSDRARIDFVVRLDDRAQIIEPMLLLPLVENSFKHGVKGDIGKTFIEMEFTSNDSGIHFQIKNNKSTTTTEQRWGGVGLENIRQRLRHAYPSAHSFDVTDTTDFFAVDLRIRRV